MLAHQRAPISTQSARKAASDACARTKEDGDGETGVPGRLRDCECQAAFAFATRLAARWATAPS